MTQMMTAVVFTAIDAVEVRSVPVPTPGPGELLIRVEAAGLCHTDLDILAGRYAAQFPRIPGHEFAGTVVDADPALRHRRGERVAVDPLIACRECRNCRRGHSNLCERGEAYGAERDGGFAEYAVVLADNAVDAGTMPPGVAALAEPFGCVVNALDRADVPLGSAGLIIGAGPMGMILAIALRGRGIDDVTVADRVPERLARARRFGAARTVHVETTLGDTLPGEEFDLIIDATGRPGVVQEAVALLADGGTLVPFGVCPPGSELTVDPFEIYRRQLRIIGSFSLDRGIPAALRALQQSPYPLDELITTRFSLGDGTTALAAVGGADTVKVQFDPTLSAAQR
nr:alcohol dehydrogenase catalytic domain-containing protein [Microbacterium barkeri]